MGQPLVSKNLNMDKEDIVGIRHQAMAGKDAGHRRFSTSCNKGHSIAVALKLPVFMISKCSLN